MGSQQLSERWSAAMMDNYGIPPIALASGSGCRVVDVDGREYLDFIGGIAVSALGHGHPAIVAAVSQQVGRIAHTSNLAIHEPGVRLAEKLQSLLAAPDARVFFTNDGTEANECAIKMSRLHGRALDPAGGRLGLVSTHNSFHGRTLGSLAITGNPAKRQPFEPLPGPVRFVDFDDVEALSAAVDSSIAAVFLEPTQGEGGVLPGSTGLPARGPPDLRPGRRAAGDRRGAERHRPYRRLVRQPGGGGATGHPDAGQGTRWRAADRGLRRLRPGRRLAHARLARQHFRWQPGLLRGGPGGAAAPSSRTTC